MSFPEVAPEPRKIFLGFLITRLMEVEEAIYNSMPMRSHSIVMIKGIMDSLTQQDKEKLKKQYDTIIKLRNNGSSEKDIEQLYADVTGYLHGTYLQEIQMGIIPASTLPTDTKPPDKSPVPERLNAKL